MAEVGNMPLPPKLLRKGVKDMVRISDARMSGTAYGTVVLHARPEAAAGGPLALIRSGDTVTLDAAKRTSASECGRRHARGTPRAMDPASTARPRLRSLYTEDMCSKPIKAPTWIFWSGAAALRSHATITDPSGHSARRIRCTALGRSIA